MNKKEKFNQFSIHAGTYDYTINVIVTKDIARAVKYVNFKLELPGGGYAPADESDFTNALGKVFRRKWFCPIIWIPEPPKQPVEHGTLGHEIFHVVCSLMRWADIPLSCDSEEAYCHLIKHLTKEIFKHL